MMAVIVFSSQLQLINGKVMSAHELSTGDRFGAAVSDYLRGGSIMSSMKALRLFHSMSRRRIRLAQPPPHRSPATVEYRV
jgi:hypothetical protein